MIEELLLPQRLRLLPMVRATGFDFERFDKCGQVTGWKKAFGQEMKMIGHNAIGVDCKISSSGFGVKYLNEPAAGRRVGKYSAPIEAAERNKITLPTHVAAR